MAGAHLLKQGQYHNCRHARGFKREAAGLASVLTWCPLQLRSKATHLHPQAAPHPSLLQLHPSTAQCYTVQPEKLADSHICVPAAQAVGTCTRATRRSHPPPKESPACLPSGMWQPIDLRIRKTEFQ